jgi:hypothetical protein
VTTILIGCNAEIPNESGSLGQHIFSVENTISSCSKEDFEYAEKYNFTVERALKSQIKIQELVRTKNTEEIFNRLNKYIYSGPRKVFALSMNFDQLFSKDWQSEVLETKPSCTPLNMDYGFSTGGIRHSFGEIIRIDGALLEEPSDLGQWISNSQVIGPRCFTQEWLSSDNLKAYEKHYSIDRHRLVESTGSLFGREIKDFSPLKPFLSEESTDKHEAYSLINPIKMCTDNKNLYESENGWFKEVFNKNQVYKYRLWRRLTQEQCNELVPNLEQKCIESYVVEVSSYSVGEKIFMVNISAGIYGLFDLPELGLSIIPLRLDNTINDSLDAFDIL